MPIAKLSTVDLAYELHGSEAAPPLLLIHGAMETFQRTWGKQVPVLSQTYRLIGPDIRGHGQSSNPAGKVDLRQVADDMAELLTHLGYDRAHVAGFSGGSSSALFMAMRHLPRLTSLTMVSNNFERDQIRTQSGFWDPVRIAQEQPRWWQQIAPLHQTEMATMLRWWAEEDAVRPAFSAKDMASIKVPTLVMGGDRDPIVPLQQTVSLYEALPDARLCVLPGVGHGLPSRRPALFNQLLLDFLATLE